MPQPNQVLLGLSVAMTTYPSLGEGRVVVRSWRLHLYTGDRHRRRNHDDELAEGRGLIGAGGGLTRSGRGGQDGVAPPGAITVAPGHEKSVIRGVVDEGMIVIDVDPGGALGTSVRIEALAVTGTRNPCPRALREAYIGVLGEGDCRTGVRVCGGAQVRIQGCRVSGHRRGVTFSGYALGEIVDSVIGENGLLGVGVSRSVVLSVIGGEISGQAVGLLLSGTAEITLTGCRVVGNRVYGIGLDEVEACPFGFGGPGFTGSVSGAGNVIPGPDDLDGNGVAGLCPGYPGAPWSAGFLVEED